MLMLTGGASGRGRLKASLPGRNTAEHLQGDASLGGLSEKLLGNITYRKKANGPIRGLGTGRWRRDRDTG